MAWNFFKPITKKIKNSSTLTFLLKNTLYCLLRFLFATYRYEFIFDKFIVIKKPKSFIKFNKSSRLTVSVNKNKLNNLIFFIKIKNNDFQNKVFDIYL